MRFMLNSKGNTNHKALTDYLKNAYTMGDNCGTEKICLIRHDEELQRRRLTRIQWSASSRDDKRRGRSSLMQSGEEMTKGDGPCPPVHKLLFCPKVSKAQLGQILIQLGGEPNAIFRNQEWEQKMWMSKSGGQLLQEKMLLNKNFLYLETYSTADQMMNKAHRKDTCTSWTHKCGNKYLYKTWICGKQEVLAWWIKHCQLISLQLLVMFQVPQQLQ